MRTRYARPRTISVIARVARASAAGSSVSSASRLVWYVSNGGGRWIRALSELPHRAQHEAAERFGVDDGRKRESVRRDAGSCERAMVAAEHRDAADDVIALAALETSAVERACHAVQERRLLVHVPECDGVPAAAQLEAQHTGDVVQRRLVHVHARAEVVDFFLRGEEESHAPTPRHVPPEARQQMEQHADRRRVVVGAGAARDGVVVRTEDEHAIAEPEIDREGLTAALRPRECMATERNAAVLEVARHRGLTRGRVAADQEARQRERRVVAAEYVVEWGGRSDWPGRGAIQAPDDRAKRESEEAERGACESVRPARSAAARPDPSGARALASGRLAGRTPAQLKTTTPRAT